jgi:hypothetical protein
VRASSTVSCSSRTSCERIDAEAIEIEQPWPSQASRSMRPVAGSTAIDRSISSPQLGLNS